MAIHRKPRPETNYYHLDKSISEDKRLSWGARGLLVFLLGKPDNWQVSVTNLVNQTAESGKPSGRDSVYSLLNELVSAGYVIREQSKNQDGKFGSIDYIVCEYFEDKPHTDKPHTDKPHTDKPHTDKPHTDKPHTVNPTQTINELKQLTKKERSNDLNNTHFDKFWEIYDKKIDRKSCEKIWAKINPSEEEAVKIVYAAGEYVKTVTDKQFQKHPKTWLNNESWNNDLIISNGATQNVTKHQITTNAANAIINSAINSAGGGYSFFAPDGDLRASVVAEFSSPTNLGYIEGGVD
jgi:hypothetical protein